MPDDAYIFDRRALRARRDRAARARVLDAAPDFLLRWAVDDIADRLALIRRRFPIAVDLGAHHGLLAARLRASGDHDLVVALESSAALLKHIDGARVRADEETLPFGDGRLDLVVSALSLQFVNDLPGLLVQIRRALRPDGLLLATLVGGDTLVELREAFLRAEAQGERGASPHVAPMADARALGSLLQRAGFALPVVDSDRVSVTYETPLALMRDLRAMGATNVLADRSRRPMRRDVLFKACELYAERFPAEGGRVRATFELITLTAWGPHESQQTPLAPGSATTRLADVLGARERPLKS
jgi:SAM-dependent methyltransferase